jgi:2'-5' RNA ligase
MPALAIICPLDISPGDRRRVEAIRARHDPQYGRVEPHFTLVFPVQDVGEAIIARRVEAVAAATPAIAFRLNAARVTPDALTPRTHIVLTPNAGGDAIRALHDALYRGDLAASLRADIPYEPHVTVGAFERLADAEAACAGIGPVDIAGHLRVLQIVSADGGEIGRLREVPLR